MYTYKLYLFVIYLLSFRWSFCSSDSEDQATKTNITFDLRNLKEHGNINENTDPYNVKHTTFTTPEGKVVEKVVYDTVNVWLSQSNPNKTLKKLVVTDKRNILQLLDLVLVNSTGDGSQEEHVYYKKQKKEFTVIQEANEYKRLKGYLSGRLAMFNDFWFIYDFGNKESYSMFVGQKTSLVDGVWKTTYAPYSGKPLLLRDGTQELWTLSNDDNYVTTVDLFEFDSDKLLVLYVLNSQNKYFHKVKTSDQWTTLESENVFNTKANEFKSKYFTTTLEHDLKLKPDYNKFWVNRTPVFGNVTHLTLNPTRSYLFNKVKFGDTVVWNSDKKENRVYQMKLTLLGYEVKTVQLVVTKGDMTLDPSFDVYYYHKDTSNTFKLKNKDEYQNALSTVKAAADRVKAFTYVDTWQQKGSRLDVSTYNAEEFTVQTTSGTNGFVTETLTPKENMWFASVGFGDTDLWPPSDLAVKHTSVKRVVLVKKNSLLQLVHLTGSKTETLQNAGTTDVEYYSKKSVDTFVSLDDLQAFESEKTKLQQPDYLVDPHVHLDVNTLEFNKLYYTVSTEVVDGVDKKVVAVKTLKVTKLTNFTNALWTRPSEAPESYVNGYEMYTFGEKKLLRVLVTGSTSSNNTTFEKSGDQAQWTSFTDNFNAKLLSIKNPSNWASLELDVSVKPVLTDFDVVVTPLKGNKTKLLLTPKKNKKVTKVKLGTTKDFFTAADNRAHKVELFLETYEAKFVKVFVWKDAANNEQQLTEDKHFKEGDNWAKEKFDEKLKVFEDEDNTVPFTYSENWVRPPETFDPKSFSATYFASGDETAELVKTTTYTPRSGTVVKKVSLYGDKVWPDGEGLDPTKKLVTLKVLSKNDMVQLLHLTNALVATPSTTEDLYYKKVTDKYEKVDSSNFNELKKSLSKADEYVDDKVKLDLSATEEVSTKLFEKETTLEDGVQKTVVSVKAGKLFQVSASPPLWTSEDGSYVTKIEKYVLDLAQLLVLHITKPDNTKETKFFEKPVPAPVSPPSERGRDTSRGEPAQQQVQETQVREQQQASGQQESTAQETQSPGQPSQQVTQPQQETPAKEPKPESPPSAAAAPSFAPLDGKSAFFTKLNQAKAAVQHQEVSVDLTTYQSDSNFKLVTAREGTADLYKLYPKATFWATSLVNGTGNVLWKKTKDGERIVEAFVYLHDSKVKFFRGVVWEKEHTDQSQDKVLLFKLEDGKFVEKEKDAFEADLKAVTTVQPTPLATETIVQPPPTPVLFRKFYLSDNVDSKVFELTERKKGEYKLKSYTPKQDMFINLVETQHGVLWKATNHGDFMKSTFFAVTDNSALAHLTLSVDSQPMHLFFKFENDKWLRLDNKTYVDLYTKAGLTSASK